MGRVRSLVLAAMASVPMLTATLPAPVVAQSPATPAASPDALGMAAALVHMLGDAVRSAAAGPWIPPDSPDSVPLNLIPPLSIAETTKSRAYSDGCHAMPADATATGCDYGVPDAPVTVVIFGDSHGAMWLPALERIAADKDWRIHLLTKSACTPADVAVLRNDKVYKKCQAWRKSAFELIDRIRPDMVIVASNSEYDIPGIPDVTSPKYYEVWRNAMADTLRTLAGSAGQVVMLNDVPRFSQEPVECLRQHMDDVGACATPRDVAMRPAMVQAYRDAAADAGVTLVDPTPLVCPGDPCQVVDGRYLVVYDDTHLTPIYARHISSEFGKLLPQVPAP